MDALRVEEESAELSRLAVTREARKWAEIRGRLTDAESILKRRERDRTEARAALERLQALPAPEVSGEAAPGDRASLKRALCDLAATPPVSSLPHTGSAYPGAEGGALQYAAALQRLAEAEATVGAWLAGQRADFREVGAFLVAERADSVGYAEARCAACESAVSEAAAAVRLIREELATVSGSGGD